MPFQEILAIIDRLEVRVKDLEDSGGNGGGGGLIENSGFAADGLINVGSGLEKE